MIETELDVLHDVTRRLESAGLLSTDCDMEYLRSRAKTLKVDALLDEFVGYE